MGRKNIIYILFAIILVMSTRSYSYASYDIPDYVDIGLKSIMNGSNTYTVQSTYGFNIGEVERDFETILRIKEDEITVGYAQNISPYIIVMDKEFDDISDITDEIDELKDDEDLLAFIYACNGGYYIAFGPYTSEREAESDYRSMEDDINGDLKIITTDDYGIAVYDDYEGMFFLYNSEDSPYFISAENWDKESVVELDNNAYRDYIGFTVRNKKIIPINRVTVDHYLYGVVPREISPSWHQEALKAQAIAARNFTIVNIDRHNAEGFDLCDNNHCQVYGGYKWEDSKTNDAIDDTRNELITYDGEPIYAYYHSNSGGKTENSENVWSNPVPYLKSVEDKFSLGSPNTNWQLVLTNDKVREAFSRNGIDIGEILSIDVLSKSENGRILEIEFEGKYGRKVFEKEEIRKIFGYNIVKSTWFDIGSSGIDTYVIDGLGNGIQRMPIDSASILSGHSNNIANRGTNRKNIRYNLTDGENHKTINQSSSEGIVFNGKGWGHGLGMSQWGAKKMAELGYSYEEIIEYYYNDVEIE